MSSGRGWFDEPYRHSLAARGIKSGRRRRTPELPKEVLVWKRKKQREWAEQDKRKGNPVEIKGRQLSIRVLKPEERARYRTHDVGRKGRLQLTLMDGKVQSYKLNLDDYESRDMVLFEIGQLRLSPSQKAEAVGLVNKWWGDNK
jgi:hypothetical protein